MRFIQSSRLALSGLLVSLCAAVPALAQTPDLVLIAGLIHGGTLTTSDWSPDGSYLAVGGASGAGGYEIRVLSFDGSTVTEVDSANHGSTVYSVSWDPSGPFIAIGGSPASGSEIRILQFADGVLQGIANEARGADAGSLSWRPDQQFLATTGPAAPTTGTELEVYLVSGLVGVAIPTVGFGGAIILAVLIITFGFSRVRHQF